MSSWEVGGGFAPRIRSQKPNSATCASTSAVSTTFVPQLEGLIRAQPRAPSALQRSSSSGLVVSTVTSPTAAARQSP